MHAAQVYDEIRTPEGNRVLNDSIACGEIAQLRGPGSEAIHPGDDTVPREKLKELFKGFSKYLEWLWRHDADEGKDQALPMLDYRLKAH